jgi:hypothetical protein
MKVFWEASYVHAPYGSFIGRTGGFAEVNSAEECSAVLLAAATAEHARRGLPPPLNDEVTGRPADTTARAEWEAIFGPVNPSITFEGDLPGPAPTKSLALERAEWWSRLRWWERILARLFDHSATSR